MMAQDGLPFLIGEAPGRTGDPLRPLAGRAGRLLCDLAGWELGDRDPDEVLGERFWIENLLDAYPGHAGKGTIWPRSKARSRAETLRKPLSGAPAAVLLGKRVAGAFGYGQGAYGLWVGPNEMVPTRHVILPHPSGINQQLNNRAVRELTGEILRKAAGMRNEGSAS